jgi:hypothetical protein
MSTDSQIERQRAATAAAGAVIYPGGAGAVDGCAARLAATEAAAAATVETAR